MKKVNIEQEVPSVKMLRDLALETDKMFSIPLPKPLLLSAGSKKVNFVRFQEAWNDYLLATNFGKKSEAEKSALIWSAMGEEAVGVYYAHGLGGRNLNSNAILGELKKIVVGEDNITMSRYEFITCDQGDMLFDDYLLELKKRIRKLISLSQFNHWNMIYCVTESSLAPTIENCRKNC